MGVWIQRTRTPLAQVRQDELKFPDPPGLVRFVTEEFPMLDG